MQRQTNMNTVQSIAMLLLFALPGCAHSQAQPKGPPILAKTRTQNVLLVTTDGMRWQEVFGGADSALMNLKDGGVQDVVGLKNEFDRRMPEDRREVLMPFVWGVM